MEKALKEHVFTQYAFSIFKNDHIRSGGRSDLLFDLASVTKPFAAISLITACDGKIQGFISDILPELKNTRVGNIKIQNILQHEAGFVPWLKISEYIDNKEDLINIFKNKNIPLFSEDGSNSYSDIGYWLTALLLNRLKINWHSYFLNEILTAYHIHEGFTFNPDIYAQNGVDKGVHDENAAFLEHNSAHAGLFGTSHAIAGFLMNFLNQDSTSPVARALYTKSSPSSRFSCGLDTPSETGYTSALNWPRKNTYGHLGFTGTAMWFNTDIKSGAILLTNRSINGMYDRIDDLRELRSEYFSIAYDFIKKGNF